jgi:hypothetical protein
MPDKPPKTSKPADTDRPPVTLSINRLSAYRILGPGISAGEVAEVIRAAGITPHHHAPSGVALFDCVAVREAAASKGKVKRHTEDD